MSADPALTVEPPDGIVRGVALVLHGGRETSTDLVRPRQLAVVRMTPFAASLRRAGRRRGLAVARLRYLVRGWNGPAQSPVADVRWALDRLAARFPDVPVAMVGHSMGGRAAVFAADHPSVSTVIGLAPWIEPEDPYVGVADRHVLVVHGDLDRTTSPKASAAWLRRAAEVAASASYVSIRHERHAMLRRAGLWHGVTTGYVLAALRGADPTQTVRGESARIVTRALAGKPSFVV